MKLNIALLGLGLSAPALATDVTNTQTTDIENQGEVLKEQKKKVDYRLGFETQWHEYNNVDFRPLDESTDQSIRDSDDRGSFAFTGARVTLGYDVRDGRDSRTVFIRMGETAPPEVLLVLDRSNH